MSSPQDTTTHTVKYTPDAYLVLGPDGATVERWPFDGDDFHGSRRVAYRDALAYAAELDEAADAALVSALIAGADACAPALSDDELIRQAGGMRACPFTTRDTLDGEIQVIDRRTHELVDSADRLGGRGHMMSALPRRLWLAELRAAAEQPADDPDPTPSPPAPTNCLVTLGDEALGYAYLDATGQAVAQGMNADEVFARGRRLAMQTGRPVRALACSLDDLAAMVQRASAA